MIHLADLIAFTMKKWAMSEAGDGPGWPSGAHTFFKQCRDIVWPRVEFKMLRFTKLTLPPAFTDYLKQVRALK
jgi:hypothetical protein